jgi:alginate O-acetyltransferase complex protein AlgI
MKITNVRSSIVLFNSFEFIFAFLPIVFIVYYLLLRFNLHFIAKCWIVITSLFFYSWWNIAYLPLILISMSANYSFGRMIKSSAKNKLILLYAGIAFNLLLLGYFKYYDFFISTVNTVFDQNLSLLHIVLPLAISFFTFQQIAFVVDSYHGETENMDVWEYSLFVLFFPQLIAGPIVHHHEIIPQFKDPKNHVLKYKNLSLGIMVFMIGIFKKVVIADSLSIWANQGYQNPLSLSFIESWVTSLAYTFQLYFDFSGYSDMAIGLGLLFNIKIPVNFLSPYRSLDIQEFWRRWHITLGRFFSKYVYIPLGGNRKGEVRTYLHLFIVFFLSGLWHGAGWTFVVWGIMHGLATIINRVWKKSSFFLYKPFAWVITFLFVHFAWVFFRADSINSAFGVIKSMLGLNKSVSFWTFRLHSEGNFLLDIGKILLSTHTTSISILLVVIGIFLSIWFIPNAIEQKEKFKPSILYSILIGLILVTVVYTSFSSNTTSEFLYFNF